MAFSPLNKVRLMIYNKELLKAAGLPEPSVKWGDPSWSWDTLREYAIKLTKRSGNITTQWGVVILGDTGFEQTWTANANGEGLFGTDGSAPGCNKEAREAIQYLTDLIHKDKVHPLWGESNTGAKIDNLFLSGQAAIRFGGSQTFASLRQSATFDWDVAPIPMKKYSYNDASLVCYGIPKKTKNPELAAKFLFYLGNEYAQKIFAEQGNVPVTKKYAEKYYIQSGIKPTHQQVVLDGMNYSKLINFSNYTDEARRLYRVYLHRVLAGEMAVDEAMDKAKIEVEAALAGKS
jgi:multiple sugar transport system substrate-binding protein